MRDNPQISPECPLSMDFLQQLAGADIAGERAFEGQVDKTKSEDKSYSGIYRGAEGGAGAFVKCYLRGGGIARAIANSGQRTAGKVFDLAASLADQVPIARPYSLVRNERTGNVYYFSQIIRGCSFAEFMRENEGRAELERIIVESAAANLALLHQHGWVHGDYKWTNLMVTALAHEDAYKVLLIDLDGGARRAHKPAAKGRDIARFIVNARDNGSPKVVEEWFFRGYSDASGEPMERVVEMATPSITKLQKRHRRKYGK